MEKEKLVKKYKNLKDKCVKDAAITGAAAFVATNEVLNYLLPQNSWGIGVFASAGMMAFCHLAFLYVYQNEMFDDYDLQIGREEYKAQKKAQKTAKAEQEMAK